MHYTPDQFVVMAIAFALAATRLLTASKPFWNSTPLAKYGTVALPALMVAFAAVPGALQGARSWTDVGVALLLVAGAGFSAAHGKRQEGPGTGAGGVDAGADSNPLRSRVDNEPPWRIQATVATLCVWLVLVACVTMAAASCAAGQGGPSKAAVSDVVKRSSALAFNGATLALLYLDEQEAKHLDSLPHPTELDMQQAVLRVERLTRARDALALVRRALAGELGDLDERGKLREAVEALDLVASELEADGVRLPKDLQSALAAARVVL